MSRRRPAADVAGDFDRCRARPRMSQITLRSCRRTGAQRSRPFGLGRGVRGGDAVWNDRLLRAALGLSRGVPLRSETAATLRGACLPEEPYVALPRLRLGHEGEETWFRDAWARTGKKLDMGKTCIRFKRVEDLALNVIAEAIRRARLKEYIAFYESSISKLKRPPSKSPAKARPKAKSAKEINPKVNHAGGK